MRSKKQCDNKISVLYFFLLISCFLFTSCGYQMTGSRLLPFHSITIKPVKNNTYEPGLEERLHNALSNEFISQGIEVTSSGGEVELQTTVKYFQLGSIGAVNEIVKEQELFMHVDITLTDKDRVIDFKSMHSPIKITFESTGTVSETVARKDAAADKASKEIAREIVSQIIIRYAK